MVKRFGPDRDVNEPMISLESEVGREIQELAALYVNSAQQFLERLQSLVLSLDAQIQECVSFHGPYEFNPYQPIRTNLATFRWSPSKDFDYPAFANLASKTFEAWYIARQRNSDVGAFNGATLQTLVGLFNSIVNRPSLDTGPLVTAKIPTAFFEFQYEVVRLNGLLCLNFPKEETPSEGSFAGKVAAVPEVEKPTPPALPFGLQLCDVPKTLKRVGKKNPATIQNDDQWALMEALMAASPNAIAESKLQHLFPHGGRDNASRRLNAKIDELGLTCKQWTLQTLDN